MTKATTATQTAIQGKQPQLIQDNRHNRLNRTPWRQSTRHLRNHARVTLTDALPIEELSIAELRELIVYDPSGLECPLKYRIPPSPGVSLELERARVRPADLQRRKNERLGVLIRRGGKEYKGHVAHVVFILMTGCYRRYGYEIHHVDGNKYNNRIENIREVNRSYNQRLVSETSSKNSLTATGIQGISADGEKFKAVITAKFPHANGTKPSKLSSTFRTLEAALLFRASVELFHHDMECKMRGVHYGHGLRPTAKQTSELICLRGGTLEFALFQYVRAGYNKIILLPSFQAASTDVEARLIKALKERGIRAPAALAKKLVDDAIRIAMVWIATSEFR